MDGVSHKGDFILLPVRGGTLDQPIKTMAVLRTMKVCLVEKLNDEMRPSGKR